MSLSLENLVIRHRHREEYLFDKLCLDVKPQQVVTLMGPSGCGKSTLLDAIAGHLSNDFYLHGDIKLNGKSLTEVAPYQRQVGILFQDDLLFPHLSVWENLAFALPDSVKAPQRKSKAMAALTTISLNRIANSYPNQISGGQRARVALARMLLAEPKLALLDEPFSKLDKELRSQFRDWVFKQLKSANIPTLMVTHDIEDVPEGSDVIRWPWKE